MGKRMGKWAGALLAALLLAGVPAWAAEDLDPVLVTFEDIQVRRSEITQLAGNLNYFGYLDSATDYDGAIEYMIVNQLTPRKKAAEAGLDQLSEADRAQIEEAAKESYEGYLSQYIEENLTDDTQEARDALRQRAIEYWASYGCTPEYYVQSYVDKTVFSRLYETLDLDPPEAEIESIFEQNREKDRAYFTGKIREYEYYRDYLSYDIWYVPEGYRGITQILLAPDQALLDTYKRAVRSTSPVQADIDAAREAILAACQADIDQIYARLEAGEDFNSLIAEYGDDPDMTGARLEEGYPVHRESGIWASEFTTAAFGADMLEIGDVSAPAVSAYGVHILKYQRDVPTEVTMTQEIRDSIVEYCRGKKLDALLRQWAEGYAVTYNEEALNALRADAKA